MAAPSDGGPAPRAQPAGDMAELCDGTGAAAGLVTLVPCGDVGNVAVTLLLGHAVGW